MYLKMKKKKKKLSKIFEKQTDDSRKNPTPYSSMMVVLFNGVCLRKSGRGNLVLSETGRTRIRNDLILIIISS